MTKSSPLGTVVIIIAALVVVGSLVGLGMISSFINETTENKSSWESFRLTLVWVAVGSSGITALFVYFRKKEYL